MLLDLPTAQQLEAVSAKLDAVLTLVQRPAAPAADDMLDVEQVAKYTGFHRKTVEKWAEQGEFNQQGHMIFLTAYRFSGRLRFKRADVEAFGLGIGALEPSIAGEPPQAIKKAAPAKKSRVPVASAQALKVA